MEAFLCRCAQAARQCSWQLRGSPVVGDIPCLKLPEDRGGSLRLSQRSDIKFQVSSGCLDLADFQVSIGHRLCLLHFFLQLVSLTAVSYYLLSHWVYLKENVFLVFIFAYL